MNASDQKLFEELRALIATPAAQPYQMIADIEKYLEDHPEITNDPEAKKKSTITTWRGLDGHTLCWVACQVGQQSVANLLLRYGADPNVGCLSAASQSGHMHVVQYLLELSYAGVAEEGVQEALRREICHDVEINWQDDTGQTALHAATKGGHLHIVSLLLSYGADPFIADKKGMNPLALACSLGRAKIVISLLEGQIAAAEPDSACSGDSISAARKWSLKMSSLCNRDESGLSPVMWAKKCGHPDLALQLQAMIADDLILRDYFCRWRDRQMLPKLLSESAEQISLSVSPLQSALETPVKTPSADPLPTPTPLPSPERLTSPRADSMFTPTPEPFTFNFKLRDLNIYDANEKVLIKNTTQQDEFRAVTLQKQMPAHDGFRDKLLDQQFFAMSTWSPPASMSIMTEAATTLGNEKENIQQSKIRAERKHEDRARQLPVSNALRQARLATLEGLGPSAQFSYLHHMRGQHLVVTRKQDEVKIRRGAVEANIFVGQGVKHKPHQGWTGQHFSHRCDPNNSTRQRRLWSSLKSDELYPAQSATPKTTKKSIFR